MAESYISSIFKELKVDSEETCFFLVEPPMNEKKIKQQRLIELFFEGFSASGLYLKNSASLASLYCSKDVALVVDIGGENTFITPISDGFNQKQGFVHSNFGGESLTRDFEKHIRTKTPNIFDFSFIKKRNNINTPSHYLAKLEIIRDVKETIFKVPNSKNKM